MPQSFSEAVHATIRDYYEGIRKRPAMFGTSGEIEAIWWILLSFEATTLSPIPEEKALYEAKRKSHELIANKHGWSGVLPFHAHVQWSEGLVAVLDEWRDEFLRLLAVQR